ASLHLREPHPLTTAPDARVTVVGQDTPLDPAGPHALLGVSSFGLSGTNAHAIVSSHQPAPAPSAPAPTPALAPPPTADDRADTGRRPHLLVLSARSATALARLAER